MAIHAPEVALEFFEKERRDRLHRLRDERGEETISEEGTEDQPRARVK